MSAAQTIRRVAVVLFNGFAVLDVYGPVQAFASCRVQRGDGTRQPLFELFSMAERSGVVKPGEGPPSYAEYGFADAPDYDILLIRGVHYERSQQPWPRSGVQERSASTP
jgi:putative intracellular protease/amidase